MLDTQQENDRESLGYLLGISTLYFLRASVQYKFVKQKKTEVSAASNFCPHSFQFHIVNKPATITVTMNYLPPPLPLPLYSF
jgi:hypothetical protein